MGLLGERRGGVGDCDYILFRRIRRVLRLSREVGPDAVVMRRGLSFADKTGRCKAPNP